MNRSATSEEVASLLGLTTRRVYQLCKPEGDEEQPVFVKDDEGNLDLHQVVPAYMKYKDKTGPAAEKLAADTEIAKYKAKEAERKDTLAERELLYAKDVSKVWREGLASIRQQCHEWHQATMNIADLKPMQREEQENEFVNFFNELGSIEY